MTEQCDVCGADAVYGRGSDNPRIVFVNPCPDKWDEKEGLAMAGRSGRVIAQLCDEAGINLEDVYVTNAHHLKPPDPRRQPNNDEIRECKPYLIEEIKALNPDVVVTLGAPSLMALKGLPTIKDVAGFALYDDELPGVAIIPTYAPGFLMAGAGRNWGMAAIVVAHLRKAQRIVDNVEPRGFGSYTPILTLENLRALRTLCAEADLLSIDTETTGLSWMDDEILCIQFTPKEGTGYAVPILHRGITTKIVDKTITKARHNQLMRATKEPPTLEEWAYLDTVDWDGIMAGTVDWDNIPREAQYAKEVYVPVPFWNLDTEMPEVIEILREILANDVPKAGQNFGFDLRRLERSTNEEVVTAMTAFGFKVNNVKHCTLMQSRLLQENLPANLTTINSFWTDIPYYEEDIKKYKSRMWELPDDVLWRYGAIDTDVVQRTVPQMLERLEEEGQTWLYENIAIPLVTCGIRMEERGVRIDIEYFDRLCGYYGEELNKALAELDAFVGRPIESPTYYANLQKLCFVEYEMPLTNKPINSAAKGDNKCRRCQRDKPCKWEHAKTGGDELAELNERAPHDLLPILILIKKLEKFKSTYLDGDGDGGYKRHIRSDQRIHGQWNPGDAETGRYTMREPNLMNPPKEVEVHSEKWGIDTKDAIRDMFTCRDGNVLMNADWAQLEVWTLAYSTQDPTLLDLLTSGEDVHAYVGRKMCELNLSDVFPASAVDPELDLFEWATKYKDIRGKAKTFVFGISYQMTVDGISLRLGCSHDEAELLFKAFLEQVFPTLPDFFDNIRQEMLRTGVVENIFRRKRHFDEVPILVALGFDTDLEAAVRQGINFPIQSGGHDLHSLVAIKHERDPVLLSRCEVVLEMHDSLAMEVAAETALETAWIVKQSWESTARDVIMPNGEPLGWEIPVDIEWGRTFGTPDFKLTARGEVKDMRQAV